MIKDEERREVAARLREIRPCKSGYIEWWKIAQVLGLKEATGWFGWEKFEPDSANRLADLIEPSCDRDALLELADEMDAYTECDDERCGKLMPPHVIHDFARRIREALGVSYGN